MKGVKRAARVAGRLQEEIAASIRALRDPRVTGVLVSRVEVTDDLQSAKVFIRLEQGEPKPALKALDAASGRLRREISQAMQLRYAPTLKFFYDESPDAMSRIEELLLEVKKDRGD